MNVSDDDGHKGKTQHHPPLDDSRWCILSYSIYIYIYEDISSENDFFM